MARMKTSSQYPVRSASRAQFIGSHADHDFANARQKTNVAWILHLVVVTAEASDLINCRPHYAKRRTEDGLINNTYQPSTNQCAAFRIGDFLISSICSMGWNTYGNGRNTIVAKSSTTNKAHNQPELMLQLSHKDTPFVLN